MSFFWKHPAAFPCLVCSSAYFCICTISGLSSASFPFIYALDVKQFKYLRHWRAEGRNLGVRWSCTANWLSSLMLLCTVVSVRPAHRSAGVTLRVGKWWLFDHVLYIQTHLINATCLQCPPHTACSLNCAVHSWPNNTIQIKSIKARITFWCRLDDRKIPAWQWYAFYAVTLMVNIQTPTKKHHFLLTSLQRKSHISILC